MSSATEQKLCSQHTQEGSPLTCRDPDLGNSGHDSERERDGTVANRTASTAAPPDPPIRPHWMSGGVGFCDEPDAHRGDLALVAVAVRRAGREADRLARRQAIGVKSEGEQQRA